MSAKSGKFITFLPDHLNVSVSQKDHSVLDMALRLGISLDHTCGGNGTCGTCLVHVVRGSEQLNERNELELEMAQDRGFAANERLACQIKPIADLVVKKYTTKD